jgi:DNA-binding transcriptional MerR regulator
VERLEFIRHLQQLGLTIDEINKALRSHDAGNATCESERWRIEAVRDRVDAKIAELSALRDRLQETLSACESGECSLVGAKNASE